MFVIRQDSHTYTMYQCMPVHVTRNIYGVPDNIHRNLNDIHDLLQLSHNFVLLLWLTYMNLPVQEACVGGDSPHAPHHPLHRQGRLQVVGAWHPVGDDGGFQGNHRLAAL